jgi:hypothetical protein
LRKAIEKTPIERKRGLPADNAGAGKTVENKLYDKLAEMFPEFIEGEHSYEKHESTGFEPLSLEWVGENTVSVMHTYTQNGDLMYDPMITFNVDGDAKTLTAASFERSNPPLYQEIDENGDGESIDGNGNQRTVKGLRGQVEGYASTWFDNIKTQDFHPVIVDIIDKDDNCRRVFYNPDGKAFDIGMGHKGNGLTVWNRAEEKDNDYVTLAHIAPDRTVKFYAVDLPEAAKTYIKREARYCDMSVSASQDAKVFHTPPEPDMPVPDPTKAAENTLEHDLYEKFAELFPDFMNQKYSNMRLTAEYAKPLELEWVFGDTLSIAHPYELNGNCAYEPLVVLKTDGVNKTMTASSLEMSEPPRNDVVYSGEGQPNVDMQRNINKFMSQWLDKIEKQGFTPVAATLWNEGEINDIDVRVTFDKSGSVIMPEPKKNIQAALAQSLPDPAITAEQLAEYGYTEEMYPLSRERAVELFNQDLTVYLLYNDNTEAVAFDMTDITGHDGMFGIEHADWVASREYANLKDAASNEGSKEAELLYGDTPMFGIYQIPDGVDDARDFRFASMQELEAHGLTPNRDNYELVYTGKLDVHDRLTNLGKIWGGFQHDSTECPQDFIGRSVSVSDVIVLQSNGEVSAHYVDRIGFAELSLFTGNEQSPLSQVGTRSDVPTVAELEADVKAGKTISLTDLSRAVHAERREPAPKGASSLLGRIEKNRERVAQGGNPASHKSNEMEVS